jgi:hypothetical protein
MLNIREWKKSSNGEEVGKREFPVAEVLKPRGFKAQAKPNREIPLEATNLRTAILAVFVNKKRK